MTTTLHSNHGGYNIFKSDDGLFFVAEPYLNHAGILRYREVGGFSEHRQARDYIHQHCMDWMKLQDEIR
jgi:hypothetical protein